MKKLESYLRVHTYTYSFKEQPAKIAGKLICHKIRRNIKYS